MKKPLISIITPVFNAEKYIAEAIHSVLNQTYTYWELLIINDGSTDSSKELILSIVDHRIHYFEQVNKGVSAARNIGLQNMKGDYFCFLDADDLLPENSLKERFEFFLVNPEVEFVDGQVRVFDTENYESTARLYKPSLNGNPFHALLNLSESCFFGLSWMIKRKKNKEYKFMSELTHSEDLMFYLSISQTGIYNYTESVIYEYRLSNNSAMTHLPRLESGYFKVHDLLKNQYNVSSIELKNYKNKVKSIMAKSYLSKLQILKALKVLSR